jgi:hypothetical protein
MSQVSITLQPVTDRCMHARSGSSAISTSCGSAKAARSQGINSFFIGYLFLANPRYPAIHF